ENGNRAALRTCGEQPAVLLATGARIRGECKCVYRRLVLCNEANAITIRQPRDSDAALRIAEHHKPIIRRTSNGCCLSLYPPEFRSLCTVEHPHGRIGTACRRHDN